MVGRDYLEAKKEAEAFDSLNRLAAEYASGAPSEVPASEPVISATEAPDPEKTDEWEKL